MGIIISCCSACRAATTTTTTAKLILQDGQLREFSSPVKVSLVVPWTNNLSFICNADEMDFNEYVSAMSGEEEFYPGQLYFELPFSWLNRRLVAEDMASLAVRAGAALMTLNSGRRRCGCCIKKVDPLVFSQESEMMRSYSQKRVGGGEDLGSAGDQVNRGRHAGAGGVKGRKFTRLDMIVEE